MPRREALVLLGTALAVQIVVPARHDWVAHVIGGGALALLVGALAPRVRSPWARRVVSVASVACVAVPAWVVEQTVFDPFDLADVAFTLAGALVVGPVQGVRVEPSERREVALVGGALLAAALAFRQVMGVGTA